MSRKASGRHEEKSKCDANTLGKLNEMDFFLFLDIVGIGETLAQRLHDGLPFNSWKVVEAALRGENDYAQAPAVMNTLKSHLRACGEVEPSPIALDGDRETKEGTGEIQRLFPHLFEECKGSGTCSMLFKHSNNYLRVASWNIKNFRKTRPETSLAQLAALLDLFDLVAIQEVMDDQAVERLKTVMELQFVSAKWNYRVSIPVGTSDRKERYAFMWRKDKVQLLGEPEILSDPNDDYVREPFVGRFQALSEPKNKKKAKFDFLLVNIHVRYGTLMEHRRKEVWALRATVDTLAERFPREKDVILAGDFNVKPEDPAWKELKIEFKALIKDDEKTTIGDVSSFDSILASSTVFKKFKPAHSGVLKFDNMKFMIKGKSKSGKEILDPKYRKMLQKEVSDHRPVWAIFRTDLGDDPSTTDFEEESTSYYGAVDDGEENEDESDSNDGEGDDEEIPDLGDLMNSLRLGASLSGQKKR